MWSKILFAVATLTMLSTFASGSVPTIEYQDIGTFKITEYCEYCSSGTTSLGEIPKEGICASDPNVVQYGSRVIIDGTEYVMADYCGNAVDAEPTIDIFREWDDGECHCSMCYYTNVYRRI